MEDLTKGVAQLVTGSSPPNDDASDGSKQHKSREEVTAAILEEVNTLADFIHRFGKSPYQSPVLAFAQDEGLSSLFETYTACEANVLADKAARYYVGQGLLHLEEEKSVTVALWGPGDAEYMATFLGLTKLGYTLFLMSPRLSIPTAAALLDKTACNLVLHSETLASNTNEIQRFRQICALPLVTRSQLHQCARLATSTETTIYNPSYWTQSSKVGFIWHSSGSTGVPKVFNMDQKSILARLRSAAKNPYFGKRVFITSSLYNSAGSTFMLKALADSESVYYYNDHLPYTPEGLTEVLVESQPQAIIIVPYALGQLALTRAGIEALKACSSVNVFGAVCPTQLGDDLVEQGVNLNTGYAMSEASILMTSAFRDKSTDKAWDYLAAYPFTKAHIWMKPVGPSLFECIILEGLANCPTSNSNDPPGSFHTKDCFVQHSKMSDRYKLIGRLDDMINMSFSETFAALPFENQVTQHPLIEEAVVFGDGRPKLGLLVSGNDKAKAFTSEELLAQVWPKIQETNAENQSWARISKDFVIVLPDGTKWPRTDKQNVIRPQVYQQFESLINQKYDNLDESANIGTRDESKGRATIL